MAEGGGRQASHVLHLTVATESAASHPLFSPHSVGGIVYVDDYGSFAGCATAVDRFLATRKDEQLVPIFEHAFWGQPPHEGQPAQNYPYDGSNGADRCLKPIKKNGASSNCTIHAVWWVKRSS